MKLITLPASGKSGWQGLECRATCAARGGDFILVTNNASDFRRLYAAQPRMPGLAALIPAADRIPQQRLLETALDELAILGELLNRVIEVDLDCDDVDFSPSTIFPRRRAITPVGICPAEQPALTSGRSWSTSAPARYHRLSSSFSGNVSLRRPPPRGRFRLRGPFRHGRSSGCALTCSRVIVERPRRGSVDRRGRAVPFDDLPQREGMRRP